jgi:hypothetical protein
VTGKESTHIDTAFMGLTSSDGVTVDCKLPAPRDTGQHGPVPVRAIRRADPLAVKEELVRGTELGMKSGTSPTITASATTVFEVAFQANTGQL